MKYTSLFSAVAVAVAMSTQAFATVTTNHTQTVDFEGEETLPGSLTGWTAQPGDLSSIIAAPLSESSAREGGYAHKHLELNTEGLELKWTPANMSTNKAIIEMKVRLVASDRAPAISDNDVHAAVYLKVDENTPAEDGLYAYTATGWQKLNTSGFNADLVNGSMVALRVVMDYAARQATYEGALLADAENDVPVYVTLGTKDMANANDAEQQGQLASISFKGTGGVDDLFVGEIEETASSATVTFELWMDPTAAQYEEALPPQTIDTVAANSAVTASFETDLEGETLTWELYDLTNNTQCVWLVVPTADGDGNYNVTMANFAFQVNHGYLVKVIVGAAPQPSLDPFSIGDDETQAALAQAGVAPIAMVSDENGDYFIVNVIEPQGATASLVGASTLDGSFTDVNATRTPKTGYTELKYEMPANETAKFFKVKFTK